MNSIQTVDTPAKTQKLTKLERRWYIEYLKDFDQLEAMRRLKKVELEKGLINDPTMRSLASQTKKSCLQKLNITDNDIRYKMGLNKEALDKRLIAKLDAKDTIILEKFRDEKGNPKSMKVDNHNVQLKALELAYKLTGELNNKLDISGGTDNTYTIKFVDDTKLKSIHSLDGEVVE